jgi:hypothetical protein
VTNLWAGSEVQEHGFANAGGEAFLSRRQSYAHRRSPPRFRNSKMHLDKNASKWLRENGSKLGSKPKERKRKTDGVRARKLKAEFLAHPNAQYVMTFQEYKDINKRDAICRAYSLELIRN